MRDENAIFQSFIDTPVLIAPQHVSAIKLLAEQCRQATGLAGITSSLRAMFGGLNTREDREDLSVIAAQSLGFGRVERGNKPFLFVEGLAIIPVLGSLLHRDSYSSRSATGYDFIRHSFNAAMDDPEVKGIIFDVDSGGGHAMGNFELADVIYEGRSKKPSLAVIDGSAYSGGYSLASAASRVVSIPSGGAGSIGVVTMHVDESGLMNKIGLDYTLIHAGAHKIDGHPFAPLPDDVRSDIEVSLAKTYDTFVASVARNRGITEDAVRATEARTYRADDALSLGLIDAIMSPAQAVAAFRKELSGSSSNPNHRVHTGASNMADNAADTPVAAPAAPAVAAPAVAAPAAAPAVAAPAVDPRIEERARVQAITSCEEAKGREGLANHLAFATDMSVEDAKKMLSAAPAATSVSKQTPFESAMASTPNPEVGTTGGGDAPVLSVGERMARNHAKVTGRKLPTT